MTEEGIHRAHTDALRVLDRLDELSNNNQGTSALVRPTAVMELELTASNTFLSSVVNLEAALLMTSSTLAMPFALRRALIAGRYCEFLSSICLPMSLRSACMFVMLSASCWTRANRFGLSGGNECKRATYCENWVGCQSTYLGKTVPLLYQKRVKRSVNEDNCS